MEELGV